MMTPVGWARADARYRAAFTEMYREHWSAVRDHINLLYDDDEAEEIANEVFQVAWDKLREPVPWGRAWLLRTADNKIQNRLRRQATRERALVALKHQVAIARPPLDASDLVALRQGLAALPPRQRRVMHLHYWDEMSGGEVRTLAVSCANSGTAVMPKDLVSDVKTTYDGGTWGAAATRGLPTSTEAVDRYDGTTAHWSGTGSVTYDALGRPLVKTDALGHTTTSGYTPAATLPATSGTTTNSAPFSWVTTTTYDPSTGAPTSIVDPNGSRTDVTIDALGRTSQVWLPLRPKASNPQSPSMAYTYTLSQTSPNSVRTDKLTGGGVVTTYDLFDGLARAVQTQSAAVGGGTVIKTTNYDDQGRAYFVDNDYWTASVNPGTAFFTPTSENNVPSQVITAYDPVGRALTTSLNGVGALVSTTTNIYSGADRVDTAPPAGGTATSTYTNTLGQKTKLTQYLTGAISGAGQDTTYGYDGAARMTSMLDPAGNAWSWTYDLLGRRVGQKDPDSGTSSATYDLAGNMTSTTDARGQLVTTTYDELNRKTKMFSGDTLGPLLASWTYDSVKKGLVTESTSYTDSGSGALGIPGVPGKAYKSTVGSYDAAGNPTKTTVTLPSDAPAFAGTSYATTLYYNADSSLQAKTLPAVGGLPGETVHYSYDSWGHLSGVDGFSIVLASTVYSPIGQLAQFNRYNGTNSAYSTYGYDGATGEVLQIKDNAVFGGAGHYVADRSYTRDGIGNVTSSTVSSVLPTTGTQTTCYTYDGLRELTRAWTPNTSSTCATAPSAGAMGGIAPMWNDYTYDTKTGNRTGLTYRSSTGVASPVSYTYPAAGAVRPHAAGTVSGPVDLGAGSYTYDAAGNQTGRPGQTLSFNEVGKVSKVVTGSATQTHVYNPDGSLLLRVSSVEGAALILGETTLNRQTGSSVTSAVRTYSAASGKPVAERTAISGTAGTTLTWLFTGLDGTVDTQTDAKNGTTVRQYRDPFGVSIGGSSGVWSDGTGFLGMQTTSSSKLTTIGSRTYDPILGKFLSVDPVTDPSNPQQNLGYAYSGNNPATFSDPTGLWLDEGCGWRQHCATLTQSPGYQESVNLGKKIETSGERQISSIPARNPFTVTPSQVQGDAETYADGAFSIGLGRILQTEHGALLYDWARGGLPSSVVFGPKSRITQGLRATPFVQSYVEDVRQELRSGNTITPDTYSAGKPGLSNPNFVRDMAAIADWNHASDADRSYATIGSFDINARVVDSSSANSVVVQYAITNSTTLGSAIGPTQSIRDVLNSIPGKTGPMSEVHETFYWEQTVSW